MNKTLVFDMDGTIVDLYGVENWLPMLRACDPTPYEIAKPLVDMTALNSILSLLKSRGWKIVVTTWSAKNSTPSYDALVSITKRAWLVKHGFPFDEFNCVPYGTLKQECTIELGGKQILIDDSTEVLESWTVGKVINAHQNICEKLVDLLLTE